MDDATYGALALVLTLAAGGYTWWAFRHRGAAAGTRGLALTVLVPAAWLTGTLRLLARIADAVGDWAVRLVFSPTVWAGLVLAGLAGVLFVLAGFLGRRTPSGSVHDARATRAAPGARKRARLGPAGSSAGGPPGGPAGGPLTADPELAEIQAILDKRGIR